ncbi:hypothetical protein ABZ454_32825 [Streptomyces sp. NPDC005803]
MPAAFVEHGSRPATVRDLGAAFLVTGAGDLELCHPVVPQVFALYA